MSTTRRPRNQYPPPPGACTLPMVPSAQILLLYPRKNRALYNITKLSTAFYSSRMSKSLFSASSESALLTWHIDTLSRRQPKCEVNSMPRPGCETRTTVQNSSWPGGMSMSQDRKRRLSDGPRPSKTGGRPPAPSAATSPPTTCSARGHQYQSPSGGDREEETPDKSRGGHVFPSRLGPGKSLLKCISPPYAKGRSRRRQAMAVTPPPARLET